MKEIIRQYGSTLLAVLTGVLLFGIAAGVPSSLARALPETKALTASTSDALESCWRSR